MATSVPVFAKPTDARMLNASAGEVVADPFPHIVKDNFIESTLYARLKEEFPPDDVFGRNLKQGGRSGRDMYRGDVLYDELLHGSPAWREFHDYINSSAFLAVTLELFGPYLKQFACRVEPAKARFVDYIEPREALADKPRAYQAMERVADILQGSAHKNELFVRLDLAQGGIGYGKPVHCDRNNRLVSMVVYFCDASEIGLQGGELLLHQHLEKKSYADYERHPKVEKTQVIGTVTPKNNRGVFFLCSNNSYHSATPVSAQKGYRNFIYVSISSRAHSIW